MKKRLLVLLLILVGLQPTSGQEKRKTTPYSFSFNVKILDQADCPLTFVEVGVQTPKPDVAMFWFTVKNQSKKTITGWEVQAFSEEGLGAALWANGDDEEGGDLNKLVFEPGQEYTANRLSALVMEKVLREQLTNVPHGSLREMSMTLAVVRVVFADGTKYDARQQLRSLGLKLFGQEDGKN